MTMQGQGVSQRPLIAGCDQRPFFLSSKDATRTVRSKRSLSLGSSGFFLRAALSRPSKSPRGHFLALSLVGDELKLDVRGDLLLARATGAPGKGGPRHITAQQESKRGLSLNSADHKVTMCKTMKKKSERERPLAVSSIDCDISSLALRPSWRRASEEGQRGLRITVHDIA